MRIWKDDPYNGSPLSLDGTLDNPLVFKLPPAGGTIEHKVWLRHDELNGELMGSSYGVELESRDDLGGDDSSWMELAEDVAGSPGAYSSSIDFGSVLGGMIVPFWVRLTMPPTPETGAKSDIYLHLTSDASPIKKAVNLANGSFFKCRYDIDSDSIKFDVQDEEGEWNSEWIDMSMMSDVLFSTIDSFGTHVNISYRSSLDKSEEFATEWVGDISDIEPNGFLQIRARFTANSSVGQVGLVRRIYGGGGFQVYKNTTEGATMPFSTSPGDGFPSPKSVKWGGYFFAEISGKYSFRCVSNDGHRVYVGGNLIIDNWTNTSGNTTVSGSGTTSLNSGWHEFEVQYLHTSGTNTISTYVTAPDATERPISLTDFTTVEQTLELRNIDIYYSGGISSKADVLIYDGPDVPILIAPGNGEETRFFRPELVVFQENSEYVEFQFDNSPLFASSYLTQWSVACEAGTEVATITPDGSRPPGTWYWRARGVLNGEFSVWSDWRSLEILPLIPRDEFLYFNVNVGLPVHNPIIDNRNIYLNANVGLQEHDPIVDDRFIYQNVNIELAVGKIIYPIYDDTRPAKTEFDGDEEFII